MKIINKKTGEIEIVCPIYLQSQGEYNSLAELNEEWEDYEEPEGYWYYDTTKNGIEKITHLEDKEKDQEIGNYFETKEEAEQTVGKLKAWKRLKDRGFKLWSFKKECCGIDLDYYTIKVLAPHDKEDLNLLFGGEE